MKIKLEKEIMQFCIKINIELDEYKKSELFAYWMYDFSVYHNEERNFNIAKSGVYSRGDVIKVNLGFNIGNELGGLHYCIN